MNTLCLDVSYAECPNKCDVNLDEHHEQCDVIDDDHDHTHFGRHCVYCGSKIKAWCNNVTFSGYGRKSIVDNFRSFAHFPGHFGLTIEQWREDVNFGVCGRCGVNLSAHVVEVNERQGKARESVEEHSRNETRG